jgi:hypothetical protein
MFSRSSARKTARLRIATDGEDHGIDVQPEIASLPRSANRRAAGRCRSQAEDVHMIPNVDARVFCGPFPEEGQAPDVGAAFQESHIIPFRKAEGIVESRIARSDNGDAKTRGLAQSDDFGVDTVPPSPEEFRIRPAAGLSFPRPKRSCGPGNSGRGL